VTEGPAVHAIYATGQVQPVAWAKVSPLIKGRLVESCFCEGDTVKAGDRLARLDDREAIAALNEQLAREQFLRDEMGRQATLLDRRVASVQAYDRAVSEHTQAKASVAAARQRLDNLTLRSPIDGVVLRRDGEIGEIIDAGQVLFWVGQPRPLQIEADVDEEDIPLVRTGYKALAKSDAFPERVLSATVRAITPKGDPVNKSYRVYLSLPDDTPLMIGMTVEINIIVAERPKVALMPVAALRDGVVWVVDGEHVLRRAVVTGITGTNRTEVRDGLKPGDQVVIDPPAGLSEGRRIRVAKQSTP
jgi:RND family efflux transporter MFP subunit